MTDFNQLDPFRRKADPLQLDLVESFANGKISRRHFIQRGTVLGLSLASISAIVAACGGGSDSGGGDTGGGAQVETAEGAISEETTMAAVSGGTMNWGMSVPGSEGVNPITMVDLVTYNVCAQVFEYLVRSSADLSLQPQLATEWSASADAKEWTFKLREGVTFHDGTPFTATHVVDVMENLIKAGNSALTGVLAEGGTSAPDDMTVVFTLAGANGLFPYLVSSDNTQSLITPTGWTVESIVEPGIPGTGPFVMEALDVKKNATYTRNESWWGGTTPLDGVEFTFIEDSQAQVAALAAGDIDGLPIFAYDLGEVLFDNPDLNIVELKSAQHREVWFRTDTGKFMDKRVRQAVAMTFDREKMVKKLLGGRGTVVNDSVIFPLYPYFASATTQRTKDIEGAKALLAEAGAEGLSAEFHFIKGLEMPGMAQLVQEGLTEAGMDITLVGADYGTFYGKYWCPAEPADPPCSGASEIGIVDYGHRGTPLVYLNAALATKGVWNSSQYASDDFMAAFAEFQAAIDVDGQKAAAGKLETILYDDVPVGIPYTINSLAAYSNKYQGVANTAMGFTFLEAASQV
jgi:peptide/nickel transport system substrate-binding protein